MGDYVMKEKINHVFLHIFGEETVSKTFVF